MFLVDVFSLEQSNNYFLGYVAHEFYILLYHFAITICSSILKNKVPH